MSIPWDDLADALERQRDAERAGDTEAVAAAAFDAEVARDAMATLGSALLAMMAVRVGLPAVVTKAIVETAQPSRQLAEWMVVEVKRLQAENWELARTLARLEMRVEQLETDRDGFVQDTVDAERTRIGEGRAADERHGEPVT